MLLKDVQLRNYQVHLADRQAKPAVALELGPLNVDVQNFDSLNQSPFNLKVDTGLGKQGKIQATGVVEPQPSQRQAEGHHQRYRPTGCPVLYQPIYPFGAA